MPILSKYVTRPEKTSLIYILTFCSKPNGFPDGLGCTIYNEDSDSVYCFHCIMAYSQNKLLRVSNLEQTYISTGFANWKEATSRFASHKGSRCHKDALLKMVSLPATMRLSVA